MIHLRPSEQQVLHCQCDRDCSTVGLPLDAALTYEYTGSQPDTARAGVANKSQKRWVGTGTPGHAAFAKSRQSARCGRRAAGVPPGSGWRFPTPHLDCKVDCKRPSRTVAKCRRVSLDVARCRDEHESQVAVNPVVDGFLTLRVASCHNLSCLVARLSP